MPNVTFVDAAAHARTLVGDAGASAMEVARIAGLDGIIAECGGGAMCATCHVYVDEAWLGQLPAMDDNEDALLDGTAAERRPNSRLSCQIRLTPQLDGLILHLPEQQV